jgi:hypothetical protein
VRYLDLVTRFESIKDFIVRNLCTSACNNFALIKVQIDRRWRHIDKAPVVVLLYDGMFAFPNPIFHVISAAFAQVWLGSA